MWNANREASGLGATDSDRGLDAFVRRYGLVSYYALAFGLGWLVWLPYVLSQNGDVPGSSPGSDAQQLSVR